MKTLKLLELIQQGIPGKTLFCPVEWSEERHLKAPLAFWVFNGPCNDNDFFYTPLGIEFMGEFKGNDPVWDPEPCGQRWGFFDEEDEFWVLEEHELKLWHRIFEGLIK